MRYIKLFFFILMILPVLASAQTEQVNEKIRAGNQFYIAKEFIKAASSYQEALTLEPGNTTAKFNLANAIARQGKHVEAAKEFSQLAKETKDAEVKSKAFFNKGAVLTQQKKLNESIEAYKQALRQDPNDKEARENLQKALLEQKKNNPPPPKKDDKKKKQEQQKKDKQQQPKMKEKEAEQRLDLLEQKEKEIQQRMQKSKSNSGGGTGKDW